MKKYIYMATTAIVVGMAAPVAAQDDFAGFAEGILGMVGSQGATVSFDARNVGADGSVEYVGFWLAAPGGEATFQADWIKGVPSATTLGQVTFTLSPNASIVFNDPATSEHILNISNSGLTITSDGITSGQGAETLNLVISADSLGISSGNPNDPVIRALDIVLSNFSQRISFSPASKLLNGEISLSSLSQNYDIVAPDEAELAASGEAADFALSFQIIADDDERNIIEYLSGATTAFVELSQGASNTSGKIYSPEARIVYSSNSEGANIEIRAENGQFTVIEEIYPTQISVSEFVADGMPLPPFDVSFDEFALRLSGPTVNHGSFEEANAEISLRNLQVSESIYSMLDPAQAISREAINVVANISANVMPKVDWSNPESAMSGNPADVAEIQDVTINEVLITAGGAQVTAEGGATIDNSMGFPFPTGKVTITAGGLQALVNGLVELGLVPQDQAGMAMGMMMAFSRPGAEPDVFVSDIEFSPQGVTANGVPLPF